MRLLSVLILTIFFAQSVYSQSIGAFIDYDKHLIIFDDGTFRDIEFQEVRSFAAGSRCVAYVDNGGSLKAYTNHISYNVSPSVSAYTITDNLFTFQVGSQLYVFENGDKRLLSAFTGNFMVGDSIVAFIDTNRHYFCIYMGGKIYVLADIIVEDGAKFWLGDNTVAYIDIHNILRLVCAQKQYELFNVIDDIEVALGRNVAAFVDKSDGKFRIFFDGELQDVEQFTPKSFKCGYESVAYVNDVENFKLFSNGEIFDVAAFQPDNYELHRNLLVYSLNEQFFTFANGQSYLVENYIPQNYSLNGNLLTYIDQNGYLCVFENGEKNVLSYNANDFYAVGDLVIFNEGLNTTKIYYQGKMYKR